jgi:hypothetical protein
LLAAFTFYATRKKEKPKRIGFQTEIGQVDKKQKGCGA